VFSNRVGRNIAALMVLQIGNYVFPLLLLPYLVRVLGLDVFGDWMFALAFVTIARTCVAYGFDLTATRQAATIQRSAALSELYQAVICARTAIWTACFLVLVGGVVIVRGAGEIAELVAVGMFILCGEILFPVWLFQGTERMGVITKIRLGTKTVNLLLVLLLVKGPSDVIYVPLVEAGTSIAAGLIAARLAILKLGLLWVPLPFSRVVSEVRAGAAVFLAQVSVHLYTTVSVIVLGVVMGSVAVGQYSIAEKIYSAVRGLLSPVVQALFPGMAIQFEKSETAFRVAVRKLSRKLLILLAGAAITIIAAADVLVVLVAGEENGVASDALRVLGISLMFALGSFFGPMLVAQRRSRQLLGITLMGGAISLVLIWPLIALQGAVGVATTFLIVQAYNSAALLRASMRHVRDAP
jgi:polysaccharide transporter, PST family